MPPYRPPTAPFRLTGSQDRFTAHRGAVLPTLRTTDLDPPFGTASPRVNALGGSQARQNVEKK